MDGDAIDRHALRDAALIDLEARWAAARRAGDDAAKIVVLRAIKRHRPLRFGEARHLFMALDRHGPAGLVDRYVAMLVTIGGRHLPPRRLIETLAPTGRIALLAQRLDASGDEALRDLIATRFARFGEPDHAAALRAVAKALVERAAPSPIADPPLDTLVAIASGDAFFAALHDLVGGAGGDRVATAALVKAARLAIVRGWRFGDGERLTTIQPAPGLAPPVRAWWDAAVAWAQFDEATADALLADAAARWPTGPLDFAAERALLAVRFGSYGRAARLLTHVDPGRDTGRFAALAMARAVIDAVPPGQAARYPEYVVDAVLDAVPPAYRAVPRTVATVILTMAPGGSERQAVAVMAALARAGRAAAQSMLVGSIADGDDFFVPEIARAGATLTVFGDAAPDLDRALAALPDAPHALRLALDALPDDWRRTVLQLVPILATERPAVVQVRQDFVAALIACRVAGVPRIILHRGTMPPDHWFASVPQILKTIRPMRHLYRRLVTVPEVTIVNNSLAGVAADRAWVGAGAADRFVHVPNTVDFVRLAREAGAGDARADLDIRADALVIGAAFRLHPVKRPDLWMAVARAVLARRPDAHFVIVGEGEPRAAMEAYAAAHGFADRLHLPGTVGDVGRWYRAMNLALLTSEREGLPNMLIEAQYFGTPVISVDIGGARETMVAGETGWLVPVDANAETIAEAIVSRAADDDAMAHARIAGPAFVERCFGIMAAVDILSRLHDFGDAP